MEPGSRYLCIVQVRREPALEIVRAVSDGHVVANFVLIVVVKPVSAVAVTVILLVNSVQRDGACLTANSNSV